MKNVRLLLYLILPACYSITYAQNSQLHFEHIGEAQGISQSNVLCITQDSKGFMWFGTWDGLNKYDGYKMSVYKNDPADSSSLSNNYINGISKSKNGNLWIATEGGGLCHFNRSQENFTRLQHRSNNANDIISNVVNCVLEDDRGMVWIGTPQGLDRYDTSKKLFEHFTFKTTDTTSISDNFIKYIFQDSEHNLWLGTALGGLNLFDRTTKKFHRYQHNQYNSASVNSNDIYSIFEDSKKRLWIGTNGNGLDLFNRQNETFRHFKHDENNIHSLAGNTVLAINEDAENNLWISSENQGISVFNITTSVFSVYKNDEVDKSSISNNSVYAIYRDSKNNMWLGNFAGGIDLLSRDKLMFTHYLHSIQPNSLSNNIVLSIMEDSKKNIWIATDGGGLNFFDPLTESFKHFRHQQNNKNSICGDNILSTCEDSKGNIWIGTWINGLTVFNPGKNTYRHYENDQHNPLTLSSGNASKIFEDKQKNIWIGTYGGGLNLLNQDGKTFSHYLFINNKGNGIASNIIVNIFEDSDGEFWLCTAGGGLILFDRKTKDFTTFTHDDETKNSISSNNVNVVFEDSRKNLWVSTLIGLNLFDKKTRQFKVFRAADGLPGEYVFGILEDDRHNIWVSTNKGISCFNPETKVFKNYGVTDGLQSNEFKQLAYCKTTSGKMYFGGLNGFNVFSPDNIRTTAFEPPLVLTNFHIFNQQAAIEVNNPNPFPLKQTITEPDDVTLPYYNSVFSFEFATLNYVSEERKRYAYMLEGFDNGWNEAGTSRSATYTNLNPGKYVFKVKGLNNEGNWSKNIRRIHLLITPPYWLTWWFKLIIFLLLAGGAIALYLIRTRAVRVQQIKLKKLVEEQTQQLVLSAQYEQKARKDTELANKELKIKNKELEQFAYVASHDLQEPLRTTSSFVELMQKQYQGRLDEKADKYLNYIANASDRMKILIKDLLDFSRIGTNRAFEKVDCNTILSNVVADISVAIQEEKAVIQFTELPVIQGHSTEIKLLFQNLLINAIKFHKPGVLPRIEVSVQKTEGYWQFSISDNGIGIEKQYRERIFDIFQRLHTRTEYTGSGIGLSHCKKIVELHNGKIWVESEPGYGSNFYFLLPAEDIAG